MNTQASQAPATQAPAATLVPSDPPTLAPSEPPPSVTPTTRPSTKPAGFKPSKVKLKLEEVADLGDVSPVYVTGDGTGGGLLYVVERAGPNPRHDRVGQDARHPARPARPRRHGWGAGLSMPVAFHPNFNKNGKFYVHYNTPAGNTRVVEYRQKQGRPGGIGGVGTDLLDFPRPEWNHNGGWLGFGPDGYLYIALGDGGGNSPGDPFGNGQDKNDLFGNILRINVDKGSPYAIPKGNPFANGGGRKELWNYGLRNPWRASFDRKTGDLGTAMSARTRSRRSTSSGR